MSSYSFLTRDLFCSIDMVSLLRAVFVEFDASMRAPGRCAFAPVPCSRSRDLASRGLLFRRPRIGTEGRRRHAELLAKERTERAEALVTDAHADLTHRQLGGDQQRACAF